MDLGGHKILVLKTDDGVVGVLQTLHGPRLSRVLEQGTEQFICPCHQGIFDRTGLNIAGPPPRPLDRFEIVKRGEQLYVNIQRA